MHLTFAELAAPLGLTPGGSDTRQLIMAFRLLSLETEGPCEYF
jgi:hypothetical protein